jgi:hypothetical protein
VTVAACHNDAVTVEVKNHTTGEANYRALIDIENAQGGVLDHFVSADRDVSPGRTEVETRYLFPTEYVLPLDGSRGPSTATATLPKVVRCVVERVTRTPT